MTHTLSCMVVIFASFASDLTAAEPLHQRMNSLLKQTEFGPQSSRCNDSAFLRRTTLTLTGTVPSAEATRKFLADKSPDKRTKLVDQLLNSPEYVRHLTNFFDVTFRERRDSKPISSTAWRDYLYKSVAANKPYQQLAKEILAGTHTDPTLNVAGKFYFDRKVEPNQLTRDVARIFFGRDLQCAQCHDHPIIDNYLQADYYGLYAFLNRTYIFTDKKKKTTILAEKAEGIVGFKSVFTKASGRTLPRLPGDTQILDEPVYTQGVGYVTSSTGGPSSPKYSRRERLARAAAAGRNRAFNRNVANRLWRMMMGRGLVEPVDYLHPANPPSHPELFELLATEFASSGYNVKKYLREIALSDIYQRSFELPQQLTGDGKQLAVLLTNLRSQKMKLDVSLKQTEKRVVDVETLLKPLKAATLKAEDELAKANAVVTAAVKKGAPTQKNVNSFTNQLATKRAALVAVAAAEKQTAIVAKQLPGDKTLGTVLATFQKKRVQFTKDIQTLEASLAKSQTAAKPFADKIAAARKLAEPFVQKLNAARKAIMPIDAQHTVAMTEWKRVQATSYTVEKQLDDIESHTTLSTAISSLATAQTSVASLTKQLTAMNGELQAKQKTVDQVVAVFKQFSLQNTAVRNALADSQKQLTSNQTLTASLSEAVKHAEVAQIKLPKDPELSKVTALLKTKVTIYKSATAAFQKNYAQKQTALSSSTTKLTAAIKSLDAAKSTLLTQQAASVKLAKTLTATKAKVVALNATVNETRDKLAEQLTNRFAVRPLQPLTPEQLAWSMLTATGYSDRIYQSELAAYKKKNPKFVVSADPKQRAVFDQTIERAVAKKLASQVTLFVRLFGASAGQPQDEFFATVDQALFLSNAGTVRSWLSPSGTNLTARLMKLKDAQAIADELYVSILIRRPNSTEIQDVTKYLTGRDKDHTAAFQELAWGLLTSAEFRFNH